MGMVKQHIQQRPSQMLFSRPHADLAQPMMPDAPIRETQMMRGVTATVWKFITLMLHAVLMAPVEAIACAMVTRQIQLRPSRVSWSRPHADLAQPMMLAAPILETQMMHGVTAIA